MNQITVTLKIPVVAGWRALDGVQVFTDYGTGTIDTDRPLLATPRRLFPKEKRDRVKHGGHGSAAYGASPAGEVTAVPQRRSGHASDPHASVAYGAGKDYAELMVMVPQDYGAWKFAARVEDGAGNQQGSLVELTHFISGEEPLIPGTFAYSSYDSGTDVVTFSLS